MALKKKTTTKKETDFEGISSIEEGEGWSLRFGEKSTNPMEKCARLPKTSAHFRRTVGSIQFTILTDFLLTALQNVEGGSR